MTALAAVVLALHAGVFLVLGVNLVAFARGRSRALPAPPEPEGGAAAPSPAGVAVSVLVPARNEEDNLRRLLPTLLAQTGVAFEAVVVDDASEDGTWAVLQAHADPRLVPVRGSGPPAGWVGKPHALYQAARRATGRVLVFLDADAELRDERALARLVGRWARHGGAGTALSGLPRYLDRGPAALLTSLVPFAILAALPTPLVPRTKSPGLSAVNGQVWVLGADDYRRLRPHEAVRDEVLEDVMIGRYLKRSGVRLWVEDLSGELAVRMYRSFGEAWAGFRKNAYLLAGGRPAPFAAFFALYTLVWVVPSALALGGAAGLAPPWAAAPLVTLVAVKLGVDRWGRFPLWVSALAPVTLALGAALQLDSAWAHARGRVAWKGRAVGGAEEG
ncbi:glycosyltransferase, partial [Rubrivirga litoralis]